MKQLLNKKNHRSCIAILLMVSMAIFIGSGFALLHIHVIDGNIVVHSHFHRASAKSSSQPLTKSSHQHSNQDFFHYSSLSVIDKFLLSVDILFIALLLVIILSIISDICLRLAILHTHALKRAPPVPHFYK
ncbi:MAG TPA: hypothetical protein ENN22_09505 [bacterium]|nr:hypothetical protein [bacterium]